MTSALDRPNETDLTSLATDRRTQRDRGSPNANPRRPQRLLLMLVLAAIPLSTACRTFSPAPEVREFDAITRQAEVALDLLRESVEVERVNRFRRRFLPNSGPKPENEHGTALQFQMEACRNPSEPDATPPGTIRAPADLPTTDSCGSDGTPQGCTDELEKGPSAWVGSGRVDAWACSLVARDTNADGDAIEPILVGGTDRHALAEVLAQVSGTTSRLSTFSQALRSIASEDDVRDLNGSLRRATIPLKVGLVNSQKDPSAEISNVDGVTGLLMQGFDSIFQLIRNSNVRYLVQIAEGDVRAASEIVADRVEFARLMFELRLTDRLDEAKNDLDYVRSRDCASAPGADRVRRCDRAYFERLDRAYMDFDHSRRALLAVRRARVEDVYRDLGDRVGDLYTTAQKLNGPSAIFHKREYAEHRAAAERLHENRRRADRVLAAMNELHSALSEIENHRVREEED